MLQNSGFSVYTIRTTKNWYFFRIIYNSDITSANFHLEIGKELVKGMKMVGKTISKVIWTKTILILCFFSELCFSNFFDFLLFLQNFRKVIIWSKAVGWSYTHSHKELLHEPYAEVWVVLGYILILLVCWQCLTEFLKIVDVNNFDILHPSAILSVKLSSLYQLCRYLRIKHFSTKTKMEVIYLYFYNHKYSRILDHQFWKTL